MPGDLAIEPSQAPGAAVPDRRRGAFAATLRAAGSLRATAALLAALVAALVVKAEGLAASEPILLGTLTALCVNLVATLSLRWRSMSRRPGILAFHLLLLAMGAAIAWGRLVRWQGSFVATEGQAVFLRKIASDRGPLAPAALESMAVLVERVESDFLRGRHLEREEIRVRVFDGAREVASGVVAPDEPLVRGGVRLYESAAAGLAAVFDVERDGGPSGRSVLFFPEYRRAPDRQSALVSLPGPLAPLPIVADLEMDGIMRADAPWALAAPSSARLRLRGVVSATLAPGESLDLPGGRMKFEGVHPWGTLVVSFDPSAPWILAIAIAAALSLAGHYLLQPRRGSRAGR